MEPKYLIFLIIALVIIFSISISYIALNFANIKLTAELSKLNPTKDTTDLVKFEKCTELNKTDTEWIVFGCKDDITVHLVFVPNGKYVMSICRNWADGKEVFQNAKDILSILGVKTNCDTDSIVFLRTENSINIYNVCGNELYLGGGCIV